MLTRPCVALELHRFHLQAKFIKIDHTFAKMEKAQAKLHAQERRLEEKQELSDKQKTAGKKGSKYAAR